MTKLPLRCTWGGLNKMATTWIFEFDGDRSYVQRQDEIDHITVRTWSNLDQDAIIVRTDFEAVQLIRALEQELESRGWVLVEQCPERRQADDRRAAERPTPDRRRRVI
jgi:hypothetical protein